MILTLLAAVGEADFVYIQRECGLTQSNLSSHLNKLEEAGYVLIEKTFKGKLPLTYAGRQRRAATLMKSIPPK